MKYSLGISNFLEEISGLSHSIVFLYFFALITEKGLLISPCYSLELCIQMGISFLFSFAFRFSSFLSYLGFFFLFFFNWRLITLQYCGGFAIHSHESAMGVHVSPSWPSLPPLSPSHLSGSSQCTSPDHPVSFIESGLVICFTYVNIHVSMLFSQIIPPFSAICKASSDNHFAFLYFFFLGMILITAAYTMLWTSFHSSSGTLSDLIPWIYFSLPL